MIRNGYTEDQIQRATAENLRQSWSGSHEIIDLYMLAEDCEHPNPADEERFNGLEDLLEAWMERNCAGLSFSDISHKKGVTYEFVWRNRERGRASISLYFEYDKAEAEYSANHGNVCLLSPMGTCCRECSDGGNEWGFEPGICRRQQEAKEAQEMFFDLFSQENLDHVRKYADA